MLEPLHDDVVVRQDIDVVLGVLAELGFAGVLEDRLQRARIREAMVRGGGATRD